MRLDPMAVRRAAYSRAVDAERAVAQAVVQTAPRDLHRERYAVLIGQACCHTDPTVARMAWTAYPQWATWAPSALGDIADAVCDLDTLTTWRTAMNALIKLLDDGFNAIELKTVFERLLRLEADGSSDADVDRDRPARQRLMALAHQVITWAQQPHGRGDLTEVSAIGELLTRQPDFLPVGLELMIWSMPINENVADRLDQLSAMTDNRPLAAQATADALLARLNRERGQLSLDLLHQTAVAFAARGSFISGLLALSLIRCAATSPSGWAAARDRNVLRVLRHHPHADIRELALDQYTRAE